MEYHLAIQGDELQAAINCSSQITFKTASCHLRTFLANVQKRSQGPGVPVGGIGVSDK